jgi:hypothetical protein
MRRKATIFADQTSRTQQVPEDVSNQSHITLSRDDYRETVKEAYKEGMKDAKQENGQEKEQQQNPEQQQTSPKQEAKNAATQEKEENKQRFEAIAARHDIELFRAKSVFPFALFPDTIIIDTTKVSVSKKQLFATEYITTIPLKDLSDVNVQTVLFLASLGIKYMPQASSPGMNEAIAVNIPNMKREDAIRAKNILKGILVARAEEIDIAKLEPEDVKHVIEKFGHSEGVD